MTAATKALGMVAADPTVTQSSKSSWTLDEHSLSKMKLTVHDIETDAVTSDKFSFDIRFDTSSQSDTEGAYGSSALDVAADGIRTETESSWRQTKSQDLDGMRLTVAGTFSDADGAGTLDLMSVTENGTTGLDTTKNVTGRSKGDRSI